MKHIISSFTRVLFACKYCKVTNNKSQIPKGDIVADRKEKLESKFA